MAKNVCANGHLVPPGDKVCPVCGAPAVNRRTAIRNTAIAGVLALSLIGGGIAGVHHLVTRNNEPTGSDVVAEQPVDNNQGGNQEQDNGAAAPEQNAPANPEVALVDPAMVRDETGVLAAHSAALNTALNNVATQTPYRLFVVYVNSFGGTNHNAWANQAAADANLGVNDLLLAVALDGQYALSYDNSTDLTDAQLNAIDNAAKAALDTADRAGANADWSLAPIAAANAIIAASH